jgi:RNA polymerase sigma-70 factor, ECF subfamily
MDSTGWGLGMDGEATHGRAADERAFAVLAERELAGAYRMALLLLGDTAEAEDAVQDALVRAWQRWAQLRDPGRAGAWFGRILVNACRDRLRSPRREVRWIGDGRSSSAASVFEEREALGAAMRSMNIDQRIVLVLRYYLDLPVEEIAARTGAPEATVRSRLRLALSAARAAYESQDRAGELR